jgi:hypothetical protein
MDLLDISYLQDASRRPGTLPRRVAALACFVYHGWIVKYWLITLKIFIAIASIFVTWKLFLWRSLR